jgi:hypothetical protein
MKNSNDTIGNRTRDVPACSAVPQPTAPPRTPAIIRRNPIFSDELGTCSGLIFGIIWYTLMLHQMAHVHMTLSLPGNTQGLVFLVLQSS